MSVTEESFNRDISRPAIEILRQIHRWIALALVLFITIIGITGAILQGIMAVYGDLGPATGGVGIVPAWVITLRQTVVKIHTGFWAGMPGAYYGLICGLGLLFFSISGAWMYLDLRASRAQLGRKGLFWKTKTGNDAALRSLHRWFTLGLVLFTTFISFTGASLDFDFVRNNMIPGAGPRPGGGPGGGGPGGGPPGGMQGGMAGGRGAPPSGAGWHQLNFTVHKLDFLGAFGHFLGIFIGLGLATMAISGLWMYLSMRARRTKAGQSGLFW